ncbi:Hypothetical_protein [Hexamita inflata]|uniref:Hypothetical_protein n=1 Tax=Hexamita inflata TaxID=28002 RepID=A0AA86QA59_9EUKA|nr:Hypothetical protein HINF_LOCUS36772 [Hexamita inflata]
MGSDICYYTENMCLDQCKKKNCELRSINALFVYCCNNSSNDWIYWTLGALGVIVIISLIIIVWGFCQKRKLKSKYAAFESDKLLKQQSAEPQSITNYSVKYSDPVKNNQLPIDIVNPPQEVI